MKLTALVPEVAEVFLKDGLAIGHALLIAKLPEGMQKDGGVRSRRTRLPANPEIIPR